MITFEQIKKIADELGPPQPQFKITVIMSPVIKDGNPILMMSESDFAEFEKKNPKPDTEALFKEL